MRRPKRLTIAAALLLVVLSGLYAGAWFYAAHRVKLGLPVWAAAMHERHLYVTWRSLRMGGFPFDFRLEVAGLQVAGHSPELAGGLRVPVLSARARPWNPYVWRLAAADGLTATNAGGLTATAPSGAGSIAVIGHGARLWLALTKPQVGGDRGRFDARTLYAWLVLPPHPPANPDEPAFGVALEAQGLSVPDVPPPLHNPIEEASIGLTVMGPIAPGPPRQAAAAWRDAGGTVELDHLTLRSGTLTLAATGTLALDSDLQPIASLSAAIEGYGELMQGLVAAGRIGRREAAVTGTVLSLFAKRGVDGRPRIATPFQIQDGEMSIGPARIGRLPHIDWN